MGNSECGMRNMAGTDFGSYISWISMTSVAKRSWNFGYLIPHSEFRIPHLNQSSRNTKPLRFSRRKFST